MQCLRVKSGASGESRTSAAHDTCQQWRELADGLALGMGELFVICGTARMLNEVMNKDG
jgi:hypothetical protein